jgi:RND family efflux transporter MFP subunit
VLDAHACIAVRSLAGCCAVAVALAGTAAPARSAAASQSAGPGQGPAAIQAPGEQDPGVRVQFAALHETVLSSELSAKISEFPFREGDTFTAGQTLVSFDCSLYHAQLTKAEASAQAARETLSVSERLAHLNSIGALEVQQASAKSKEADAEAAAMRATVGKCSLAAPFSGRVAKVSARRYQFVAPGQALLEILSTQQLELQMIVPSRWLVWLRVGGRFSVHVDELDQTFTGRVERLGARIDPVSQSISLAGRLDGSHAELLPGMSGIASFDKPNERVAATTR